MRKIARHWEENYLDEESLHFIRIARSVSKIPQVIVSNDKRVVEQSLVHFFNSFDIFWNTFFHTMAKWEPVVDQIPVNGSNKKSRNQNEVSALKSNYTSTYKAKSGFFGFLNNKILAEHLFFFLDVTDLCSNKLNVNRNWHKAYKTHLNARIYLLSEETRFYETINIDMVESIRHKRAKYYSDFEIDPPRKYLGNKNDNGNDEKNKAIRLLNSFTHVEVSNLKRIKKYSKAYELYWAPLVILWNQKPHRSSTADGKVHISYWKTAFKIFSDPQFLTKIKEFKLESISQQKFQEIERFIQNQSFEIEKAENINKWLASLVKWSKGVYLFHQYLREYALNSIDLRILTQTEKKFALLMDNLCYRNFRMLRYVQEHCHNELPEIEGLINEFKHEKSVA